MISIRDYPERVYAGVLGKMIGVYLGRPFEGWGFQQIDQELGEVNYYVHERLGKPLIVTDDDLAGTFTFIRALADYDFDPNISSRQIGQTWLNYLIENRTTLWWGGLGNSTEHTAYLRLKKGLAAPLSGSMKTNGRLVAEQIGAQIFIDAWALICPGEPEKAAHYARRAAAVSHDGEAVNAACVMAAMQSLAFIETNIDCLLEEGLRQIPAGSLIYRMIQNVRSWQAAQPDWRKTHQRIIEFCKEQGYGGLCHIIPNHALIINALLYGQGDFQKSLMIVNTSGEDTDCNSGNLGCLLGIREGLAAFEGQVDWRGPVADRLYLSTADGGRAVTDAVQETYHLVNSAYALAGSAPVHPKAGARFHFSLPGSVQGFSIRPDASNNAWLENVEGHSAQGERSLAIHYQADPGQSIETSTPTFIPPEDIHMQGYNLEASPTLYPGQLVRLRVEADSNNHEAVTAGIIIYSYGKNDTLIKIPGPVILLEPGEDGEIEWLLPPDTLHPIANIGMEFQPAGKEAGTIYLDYLTWEGNPEITFKCPSYDGSMWEHAWVKGVDNLNTNFPRSIRIAQNEGIGLLIQGCREWAGYRVEGQIIPHLMASGGIGACVQGMRRYYALILQAGGKVALVKALDGLKVLAETELAWVYEQPYTLALEVHGAYLTGWVNGTQVLETEDLDHPLKNGAVALICEEGCITNNFLAVSPSKLAEPRFC